MQNTRPQVQTRTDVRFNSGPVWEAPLAMTVCPRPVQRQTRSTSFDLPGLFWERSPSSQRTPAIDYRQILGQLFALEPEVQRSLCPKFRTYVRSERELL